MNHFTGGWMTESQMTVRDGEGEVKPVILVIEPYSSLRESVCGWLAIAYPACQVIASRTVKEALQLLRQNPAVIILLSVEDSVPNQVLDTRTLLDVSPHSRLVLLTAFDDEEYRTQALLAGAAGCISKQHLFQELASLVKPILQG